MYVLGNWPLGAHELFVELGVLKETEPSNQVWLWECTDPDWAEPMWLPDAQKGGKIMGFCSCGNEWCGVHVVDSDRRRQWAPSVDGLFSAVAHALGGNAIGVVPQRIARVGTLDQDDIYRELFLVRGAAWPDVASVIGNADRLCRSVAPAVLVMGALPPKEVYIGEKTPVVSLAETVSIEGGAIHVDLSSVVSQCRAAGASRSRTWMTVTEAAQLLMRDLPGLKLETARARVSVAASRQAFQSNKQKGARRLIDADSFSAWRLQQRDKDLDAEDEQ